MLKKVDSAKAPKAFGHYSQAVVYDNRLIFCSAQVGIVPGTTQLISEDILSQSRQVFQNIQAILEEANSGIHNIVKVDIFLTNINYFAAVNELYSSFFKFNIEPARQTVEVSRLPRGASISMSCIAYINEEKLVNTSDRNSEY